MAPRPLLTLLVLGTWAATVYAHGSGHGHGSGAPLEEIDEDEILRYHAPNGVSYYDYDYLAATPKTNTTVFGNVAVIDKRHGGLMMLHATALGISYLGLLPLVIALSAGRHRLATLARSTFWSLNLIGWAAGRAYRRLTPDLYHGSTHATSGAVLIWLSAMVAFADIFPALMPHIHKLIHLFKSRIAKRKEEEVEYMLSDSPVPLDDDAHATAYAMFSSHNSHKRPSHWKRHSINSDHSTLHDDHHPHHATSRPSLRSRLLRLASHAIEVVERSLVVYAWGQILSGFTIYVGWGRAEYINGILAHFIKGSIFWWYGILTFARYMGAWASWGWAWNTFSSKSRIMSASFLESLVIFVYGFTQQFMERLGKHPGDPYSAKDIEHISIAVMFWAGGLVGMAVESPAVRRWLIGDDNDAIRDHSHDESERERKGKASLSSPLHVENAHLQRPTPMAQASSSPSPNPLPAVVIGITGIAMSAHHQTYRFQVQIHSLWGFLLLGFAICRCITCFLQWVKPIPSSFSNEKDSVHSRSPRRDSSETIMEDMVENGRDWVGPPSRPPSELVGSIFLGAGGISFICSDEQVTFWAMRTERDDMMMFLNLAIALTAVAYVWTTLILLVSRIAKKKQRLL
ncbi:SubName: Full=Related to YTP1 {ECO:0000313/EMBL:CCA69256.1} [Serendipita indica DSM 11827]|nr:SubName: Full=Related to YTP1 {ECO:0000313/EMBL:CCA69256.1} [Serendipita indica DSM 11827]